MNLAFLYSSSIHFLLFVILLFCFHNAQTNNKKNNAVYTIDFIGASATPMRYGETEQNSSADKAAQEAKAQAQKAAQEAKEAQETALKIKEEKKKAEYNSAQQIAKKAKKDTKKKKEEKKVVLSKPSILGSVEADNIDVSKLHNLTTSGTGGGPNTVQANFTNFPYPWYITQVRNALWKSWQEKRPKGDTGISTLVSFNIDRNGVVYGVQIESSSGNDSYDYAALSAATNSAPYPPLPKDFEKDILTVTVEFKQEV